MAVAVKKKSKASASQWTPRMAGLLLCAFFVLGVMTGFSEPGRRVATRARNLVIGWTDRALAMLGPVGHALHESVMPVEVVLHLKHEVPRERPGPVELSRARNRDDAIAIVERRDGFYALLGGGEIRGPVSPNKQPDLPIVSGPAVESAKADELLSDAELLVRAEAQLSSLVSEMRVDNDGTASFFLDRERMALVVDKDQETTELHRAMDVLKQWEGRERLIAMLDMTTPGMAIVRLKADLSHLEKRAATIARNHDQQPGRVRIADRGR